jgi:hypothetical protein
MAVLVKAWVFESFPVVNYALFHLLILTWLKLWRKLEKELLERFDPFL